MNWDAIGAIAELAGAVGVIASLVYLATQIRQITATVRASGSVADATINEAIPALLARDDSAPELYHHGLEDYESLTPDEARKFGTLLGLYPKGLQQSVLLRGDGALSDAAWSHAVKNMRWVVSLPSFQPFWNQWGAQYADPFVALVEEILGGEADRGSD